MDENVTIKSLSVDLNAEASDSSNLDSLVTVLKELKTAVSGSFKGLKEVTSYIKTLGESLKKITASDVGVVTELSASLELLSDIGSRDFSGLKAIGDGITSMSRSLSKIQGDVATKITDLAASLELLSGSTTFDLQGLNSAGQAIEIFGKSARKLDANTGSNLLNLSAGLELLQGVATSPADYASISSAGQAIQTLARGTASVDEGTAVKVSQVGDALSRLGNLAGTDFTSLGTASASMTQLAAGLSKIANVNVGNFPAVESALQALSGFGMSATNASSLTSFSEGLKSIFSATNSRAAGNITSLRMALDGFGAVASANSAGITSAGHAIAGFTASMKGFNPNTIARGLNNLGDAMEKVSKIDPANIAKFGTTMQNIATAVTPLSNAMQSVAAGFSSLPRSLYNATNSMTRFRRSTVSTFAGLRMLQMGFNAARMVFGAAMDTFNEANRFEETINLAVVAMNKGADAAINYAEKVERLAGINMSDWVTHLSATNQIFEGFGVSAKQANNMSQQLTQLGYDIQSAFNVENISTVMNKLQSGITGQIRGMRTYGVELSVAAMQEYALAKGITTKWDAMTQAQKAELRYAKIMETTKNIQGDLARTIATPTNALRILSNQWDIAKRYIGQFVSVIAARLIPVVQTAVNVIAALARALASMWGYALPKIDYSGLAANYAADADDIADSVKKVGGAAGKASDEMKGLLADFDELNIIAQENTGGGGGGGGGASVAEMGDLLGLADKFNYDFLNGLTNNVDELKEKLERLLPIIGTIGAALLAWRVGDTIARLFGLDSNLGALAAGLTLEIGLVFDAVRDMLENGINLLNLSEWIAGALAGSLSIAKVTGSIAKGFKVGFGLAFIISGITLGLKEGLSLKNTDAQATMYNLMSGFLVGLGLTMASGSLAAGAITTLAVFIGLQIARAYIKDAEAARQKLRDCFGSIDLTQEEVDALVQYMIEVKDVTGKIKLAVAGFKDANADRDVINESLKVLETQVDNFLINPAVDDAETTVEDLKSQVNTITAKVKESLDKEQNALVITLGLVFGENSEKTGEITDTSKYIRDTYGQYVERLGEEFNSYIAENLKNKKLQTDEFVQQKAKELFDAYKKAASLADDMIRETKIASVAYNIMVQGEVTKETAEEISKKLEEVRVELLQDAADDMAGTKAALKFNVQMAAEVLENDKGLDPAKRAELQAEYEKAVGHYQDFLDNESTELATLKFKANLDFMELQNEVFKEPLNKYWNLIQEEVKSFFDEHEIEMDSPLGNINEWVFNPDKWGSYEDYSDRYLKYVDETINSYRRSLEAAFSDADIDVQSINNIWKTISSGFDLATDELADLREKGERPPKEFVDAYTEQAKIGALKGIPYATDYLTGASFIKDEDLRTALSTMEGVGRGLPEAFWHGYTDGLSLIKDNGEWVLDFGDGIQLKSSEWTDALITNLKEWGLNLEPYTLPVPVEISLEQAEGFMDSVQASINEMYESIKLVGIDPDKAEITKSLLKDVFTVNEEMMEQARETGKRPAEELVKAFTTQMQVEAFTGNQAAVEYLTGATYISDSDMMDMLSNFEGIGARFSEAFGQGYTDALKIIQSDNSWILDFGSGITADINSLTPTFIENLKQLGLDLTPYIEGIVQDIATITGESIVIPAVQGTEEYIVEMEKIGASTEEVREGLSKFKTTTKAVLSTPETKAAKAELDSIPTKTEETKTAYLEDVKGMETDIPEPGTLEFELALDRARTEADDKTSTIMALIDTANSTLPATDTSEFIFGLDSTYNSTSGYVGDIVSDINGAHTHFPRADGSALTSSLQDISSSVGRYVGDIVSKINTAKSKIGSLGEINTKIEVDTGSGGSGTKQTVSMHAGGGIVKGDLFVANESGPELIGRFGNQTAVANTEQIVSGIAQGVATANSEQNSLLGQAISLLAQIAEKEMTITPSPALGRVVAVSQGMYSRSTGV